MSTEYKNTLTQEPFARRLESTMWYAGIDWANDHHDVVEISEKSHQVGSLRVGHSPQGLMQLSAFLEEISGPGGRDQMACIVETSRGLLIASLLEAGWHVYPIHPKTIDRRRAASGAKTDAIDAYLLAKHGRAELADLRQLKPDSPLIAELKALTRDQDSLIQSQTRLINQLTACLKSYYPVSLHLFAKLHQRSTLIFLQHYPTPQLAMNAKPLEIEAVLRQARHSNPQQAASSIFQALHQPHLQADEITTRTKSRLMLVLVKQLLPLVEEIAEYDKVITALFLKHEDMEIFRSLPRAGKRLAPCLLAEIGDDRSRYRDASGLAALAGTSPVLFQSGTYAKAHRRYACSKPLRNALHQFARPPTKQEQWARDYYQRKRAEGKSHSEAVRALSNVWVRVIFALWHKQESYQTATFEAAQHAHARKAA